MHFLTQQRKRKQLKHPDTRTFTHTLYAENKISFELNHGMYNDSYESHNLQMILKTETYMLCKTHFKAVTHV